MTIASKLIQNAFREGNLLPVGKDPTDAETAEALDRLNNIIVCYFGQELGEKLEDWNVPSKQRTAPVSAHYPFTPYRDDKPNEVTLYPPPNVRLITHIVGPTRVYLQQQPEDGARMGFVDVGSTAFLTIDGNGRLIENDFDIAVDPPDPQEWFYRADLANWVKLEELTLTAESPFPKEFDDLLICDLAIRLSARFGNDPRSGTIMTYKSKMEQLKARYRQHPLTPGKSEDIPRSWQSYLTGENLSGGEL